MQLCQRSNCTKIKRINSVANLAINITRFIKLQIQCLKARYNSIVFNKIEKLPEKIRALPSIKQLTQSKTLILQFYIVYAKYSIKCRNFSLFRSLYTKSNRNLLCHILRKLASILLIIFYMLKPSITQGISLCPILSE